MAKIDDKIRNIRALLDFPEINEHWLQAVVKELWTKEAIVNEFRHDPNTIQNAVLLLKHWNKKWGKVEIGRVIKWHRTDGGPVTRIHDPVPPSVIFKLALRGQLKLLFDRKKLPTYVAVGIPDNWRQCKTYVNGKLINNVEWADALFGACCVITTEFEEKVLLGDVTFEVGEDESFF